MGSLVSFLDDILIPGASTPFCLDSMNAPEMTGASSIKQTSSAQFFILFSWLFCSNYGATLYYNNG
jgi:hypothetical protein